jgi:molecular chaperone GrpE
MPDRQALFEKFLDYLQAEQTPPEFLGEEPETTSPFDPYQMVAEWTALRHEVKQQGKLLHSAQEMLQQALEAARADKEQLQLRLEESQKQALAQNATDLTAQKQRFEQEQENLLRDLLSILDALDHASAHWQEELVALATSPAPKSAQPRTLWGRLAQWFGFSKNRTSRDRSRNNLSEILTSNQQGVELIRRSLLEVLRQRQVVPMEVQGKPFDPQHMYALGRQETEDTTENTVFQEVVRGYMWGAQILREPQVIVTVGKKNENI